MVSVHYGLHPLHSMQQVIHRIQGMVVYGCINCNHKDKKKTEKPDKWIRKAIEHM